MVKWRSDLYWQMLNALGQHLQGDAGDGGGEGDALGEGLPRDHVEVAAAALRLRAEVPVERTHRLVFVDLAVAPT